MCSNEALVLESMCVIKFGTPFPHQPMIPQQFSIVYSITISKLSSVLSECVISVIKAVVGYRSRHHHHHASDPSSDVRPVEKRPFSIFDWSSVRWPPRVIANQGRPLKKCTQAVAPIIGCIMSVNKNEFTNRYSHYTVIVIGRGSPRSMDDMFGMDFFRARNVMECEAIKKGETFSINCTGYAEEF